MSSGLLDDPTTHTMLSDSEKARHPSCLTQFLMHSDKSCTRFDEITLPCTTLELNVRWNILVWRRTSSAKRNAFVWATIDRFYLSFFAWRVSQSMEQRKLYHVCCAWPTTFHNTIAVNSHSLKQTFFFTVELKLVSTIFNQPFPILFSGYTVGGFATIWLSWRPVHPRGHGTVKPPEDALNCCVCQSQPNGLAWTEGSNQTNSCMLVGAS